MDTYRSKDPDPLPTIAIELSSNTKSSARGLLSSISKQTGMKDQPQQLQSSASSKKNNSSLKKLLGTNQTPDIDHDIMLRFSQIQNLIDKDQYEYKYPFLKENDVYSFDLRNLASLTPEKKPNMQTCDSYESEIRPDLDKNSLKLKNHNINMCDYAKTESNRDRLGSIDITGDSDKRIVAHNDKTKSGNFLSSK